MLMVIWDAVNRYLRICMLNLIAMVIFFRLMSLITYRKSSWFWGCVYIAFRILIIQLLLNSLLTTWFSDELWVNVLLFAGVVLNLFVSTACACHIFSGSLLKIVICCGCSDLVGSSFVVLANVIVNFLQGRSSLAAVWIPFAWSDFLLIPAMLLPYALFERLFGEKLKKFRDYEPGHRKLFWCVVGIYMFLNFFSFGWDNNMFEGRWLYCITIPFGVFVLWAAGMGTLDSVRKRADHEYAYLCMQRRLAESCYDEANRQLMEIRGYQKLIEMQMEEIGRYGEERGPGHRYRNYLRDLRDAFRLVKGVYCSDWAVDALLCQAAKRLADEGISAEFRFQGYDGGGLDTGDVLTVLRELFYTAYDHMRDAAERTLLLSAAAYKNRLVFELKFSVGGGKMPSMRKLCRELRFCEGTAQRKKTGDMCGILCTLQKPQS